MTHIDRVTGWRPLMKSSGKNLPVAHIWTGPSRRSITFIIMLVTALAVLTGGSARIRAQQTGFLAEGIRLYEQGRVNEALDALNSAVEENPRCPLACYYAALIRVQKEQFPRAQQNLEAAIRDSSDFHDAYGLLAVTLRERGDDSGALEAWRRFIENVGALEGSDPASLESIMLPDIYHRRLREETERNRDRLARGQDTPDPSRGSRETEHQTPPGQTEQTTAPDTPVDSAVHDPESVTREAVTTVPEESGTASNMPDEEVAAWEEPVLSIDDTPLREIEEQISADIKNGVITFIVALGVLFAVTGGILWWSRKRRTKPDEIVFSEQVERLLDDLQFELDEDRTIREFEGKKQEIIEGIESVRTPPEPAQTAPSKNYTPAELTLLATGTLPVPPKSGEMTRAAVTEEVKTLVSRLSREGRSPEEIAHTADLTTTEVNLILAVRDRKLEDAVSELHRDESGGVPDKLFEAVASLREEGASSREIARKLEVSLSEVKLVSSLIALKQRGQ